MKFSQMTYQRPDYPAAFRQLEDLTARLQAAGSAGEQVQLYRQAEELLSHLSTQATLCSIRYTVDTRDPFYEAENEYNDQQSPCSRRSSRRFRRP